MRIISGGQTGADQGGLFAAHQCGVETGGWVPSGCRTEAGPAPWLVTTFGCTVHESRSYVPRTLLNVRDADGTVWFGLTGSAGGKITLDACKHDHKPVLINPEPAALAAWIQEYAIETLNVAGNRESTHPGNFAKTMAIIVATLKLLGHPDLTSKPESV